MKFPTFLASDHLFLKSETAQIPPIYQTSSFRFKNLQEGIGYFSGRKEGNIYARYGHPNLSLIQKKLAAFESLDITNPKDCLLTNSGMSAIHTALSYFCAKGDRILAADDLYGGTSDLFNYHFKAKGISIEYIDLSKLSELRERLHQDSFKILYLESPSNPLLKVYDITQIANFCKQTNTLLVVDNTFNTPLIQQPLELGADIVLYSTTKYLNGHGTSLGGAILFNKNPEWYNNLETLIRLNGSTLSPFEAWLLNEGIKTLPLRLKKQQKNAKNIFKWLRDQPNIGRIFYPGDEQSTSYSLAKKQMRYFGGMISFEVPDPNYFCDHLNLISLAPTLGDLNSLVLHPASMSHRNMDVNHRKSIGISDTLVRLSVGIEDTEDIIEDIARGLG